MFDYTVIGAGILGLCTAHEIKKRLPDKSVLILEKESGIAKHQTGRNSGVIHSGIYYKPGSLKAVNCSSGRRRLINFCEAYDIPFKICGKVIVAVNEAELPTLNMLLERGQQNQINCRRMSTSELKELEPHVSAKSAIHVSDCGIINYKTVCEKLTDLIVADNQNRIVFNSRVTGIKENRDAFVISAGDAKYQSRYLINCGGLRSDEIVQKTTINSDTQIIPFRGEYYKLKPTADHLCRHLIYPVPDMTFPFLGVHFTRRLDGMVECGPNAVLALGKEAYKKTDVNIKELQAILKFPGFRSLCRKYMKQGLAEIWRSVSKKAFVNNAAKLIPEIKAADLERAPSGIRAQAVDSSGALIDDFKLYKQGRSIHVLNAPSPAATAGFKIAESIFNTLHHSNHG